jgi:hypothetical protein
MFIQTTLATEVYEAEEQTDIEHRSLWHTELELEAQQFAREDTI